MERYVIASLPRRVLVYLVDKAIISVIFAPIFILVHKDSMLSFMSFMVVTCAYHTCLTYKYTATIGQRLFRVRVVSCKNQHVNNALVAFDRVLLQFLCPTLSTLLSGAVTTLSPGVPLLSAVLTLHVLVIFFWACWYLTAAFVPQKQTIHDWLCGTVVVTEGT